MPVTKITPITKKTILYTDFHKDMTQNPISEDVALKTNEESVKEAIKNLILTDKGERLMQPTIGGNIRAMLFENNTPATIKLIQDQIETVIREYEPRASIIEVNVQSSLDENKIQVTVYFYINNNEQPISVSVFLERIR